MLKFGLFMSPSKIKKHSRPSFKFAKRDKFHKPKEKDKDKEKEEKKEKKEEKKKEEINRAEKKDKPKFRKKFGQSSKPDQQNDSDGAKPVFSVPIEVAVARSKCHDGVQLPAVFRECIDYIEEFGLSHEGIYRISGVKSKVQALKEAYNKGISPFLHEVEPSIVASLLKLYLRELPEPVLTAELMPRFEQASTIKNLKQKIEEFQFLINCLPVSNRTLLSWMIVHMMHVIAREAQNKMSLQNVSIVLSPTMQISHRVLNVFFSHSRILFRDTVIKIYRPPLRPVTSRWSLELPESPTALEEELHKQESLLAQLHTDLMTIKDSDKEEQLWEVQRVVTQLKRKLKHVKKAQEAANAAEKRENELSVEKLKPAGTHVRTASQVSQVSQASQPDELNLELRIPAPITPASSQEVIPDSKTLPEEDEHLEKDEPVEIPAHVSTDGSVEKPGATTELEITAQVVSENGESHMEEETTDLNFVDHKQCNDTAENFRTEFVPVPEINLDTEVKVEDEDSEASSQMADFVQTRFADGGKAGPVEPTAVPERTEIRSDESQEVESAPVVFTVGNFQSEALKRSSESVNREGPDEPDGADPSELHMGGLVLHDKEESQPDYTDEVALESPLGAEANFESGLVAANFESGATSSGSEELAGDDREEYQQLLEEHHALCLEQEELTAMGDELRQKIGTERSEIERLDQDITEVQAIHRDLYSSDEVSSSSDSSDEEEDELQESLQQLISENKQLQRKNSELCEKIHAERMACLEVKVQIRMIQQRQQEASTSVDLLS